MFYHRVTEHLWSDDLCLDPRGCLLCLGPDVQTTVPRLAGDLAAGKVDAVAGARIEEQLRNGPVSHANRCHRQAL